MATVFALIKTKTPNKACRRLGYASRIHRWLAQSAERLTQTVGRQVSLLERQPALLSPLTILQWLAFREEMKNVQLGQDYSRWFSVVHYRFVSYHCLSVYQPSNIFAGLSQRYSSESASQNALRKANIPSTGHSLFTCADTCSVLLNVDT